MGLKSVEQSRLLSDFLSQCGGYVVIDCGLATELERHGADLNDPSWSAKCLLTFPHLVRKGYMLSCLLHPGDGVNFIVAILIAIGGAGQEPLLRAYLND